MYLKRLEMVGFKSFADKTRLEFEPGLMAIVGPNGCGKSNIADAIRWVLGEQSAKALRGAKMEDVIFNGTDSHKAMGLAEVSLTLAECETALGTEFNEVTITRRVYRSGEGQYLLNKTPCRLRDIQRLFMDTGIGTNSYSLLEQGRIDRILSSRPEDRRAVFEEASGITKYKADRKEALRKLEYTEANLLRVADIIREVKRQIISLQRQAGKARRYQEIHARLRQVELFFIRGKLEALEARLAALDAQQRQADAREREAGEALAAAETAVEAARAALAEIEREMEAGREQAAQARAGHDRAMETIRSTEERIRDLSNISLRDSHEAELARKSLADCEAAVRDLGARIAEAAGGRARAEQEHAGKAAELKRREEALNEAGRLLHNLRNELVQLENTSARLNQELLQSESREREAILRRERLTVERVQLEEQSASLAARRAALEERLGALRAELEKKVQEDAALRRRREDGEAGLTTLRQQISDLRARTAAREAQAELLRRSEQAQEGFPGGARLLMDAKAPFSADRSAVRGALARHLRAEPSYQPALEAVLRPWLDALIVRDGAAARDLLRELDRQRAGSARLLAADGPAPAGQPPLREGADRLLEHVRCADEARAVAERLLGRVYVAPSPDQAPAPLPAGEIWVTPSGVVLSGDGFYELWMTENRAASPLARRQQLAACEEEVAALRAEAAARQADLETLQADRQTIGAALDASRAACDEARRNLALIEGEFQVTERAAREALRKIETVSYELGQVSKDTAGQERRQEMAAEIERLRARQTEVRTALEQHTGNLRALEQARMDWLAQVTESRVDLADRRREEESLAQRRTGQEARVRELELLIRERAEGLVSYQSRIEELQQNIVQTREQLQPLDEERRACEARVEAARARREAQAAELSTHEHHVRELRAAVDGVRRQRAQADIEQAEQRLRHQTLLDRAAQDHKADAAEIRAAPAPAWEEADGGEPADAAALEERVLDLRRRLEALGPVNLVAIEEYQQLEERHQFLTTQQTDLVNAKQQLVDLIRKINETTTQMFAETFAKVNENFREMFTKLFGGGTAKLVMVNEEDVLESGIEIIARPPGKKLQSVSLLSGGERTMTAVGLLFSLYLVKPSPFCMLDELDAALDETNIGRFVSVVQDFIKRSQFIVITHNRRTIAAANVLYGVTMEKHGISKIVSVKFNKEGRVEHGVTAPAPAAAKAPAAPAPAEEPPAAEPPAPPPEAPAPEAAPA